MKMKRTPNGSPLSSTPLKIATPTTATTSAIALRLVRVKSAATVMGPMNSIDTPLPRGKRSIAM
jgi:hypothetical protein